MRRYALLGTNITESLSPALHARAFEALDMAASYDLWPCQDSDFEAQVERAREQLDGFNLTAPFKQAILPYLDSISPRASALSSVNAVRVSNGQLHGENTDIEGLKASLKKLKTAGGEALVLGAGGVIGSVMQALAETGFSSMTLCARRQDPALAWLRRCPIEAVFKPWDERQIQAQRHRLVVQATPLGGRQSDPPPLSLERFADLTVLDLVYRLRGTTALIGAARAAGLQCLDGRTMLREQAVGSHRVWGISAAGAEAMRDFLADE